jgi:hypothetical protein
MDGSKKEPIPLHFDSAEAAGDFWDTHSAADYWDETEEVEMEFEQYRKSHSTGALPPSPAASTTGARRRVRGRGSDRDAK